ncbi:MAG: VWA domain-containing protein, partial [Planctomycetota bacterium]|nr:VWA domain-containing protein [Planctomycetota bacterium]
MTFLAPIAGLIAAAITAPLLLLLYFLKLRRRPVRVSSTLLWSRAVRDLQVNAPFRWIRPTLLLFLQLLALACLLIAFARPAITGAAPPGGRLILLIDASASMSAPAGAESPDQSRLDEAKAQAIDFIDRLARTGALGPSEAMVIAFDAGARAVTNFVTDRAALRRAIQSIEPTDQPGDLDAALKLVEAQIARAGEDDQPARPQVILISDG